MRFMNGDNPAVEMEDGTQHGRHFGCVGCDGNINRNYHLAYTFQRRHQTLLKSRTSSSQLQQEESLVFILSKI